MCAKILENQSYNQLLQEQAVRARRNSYAPYSNFAVGAALLADDGTIYTGCNIENASYPLGNCAERTAFFKAVSDGKRRFTAIAIAGGPAVSAGADQPVQAEVPDPEGLHTAEEEAQDNVCDDRQLVCCPPCGACRQVMREFCGPDFIIMYSDGNGAFTSRTLKELLPDSFGPEQMER